MKYLSLLACICLFISCKSTQNTTEMKDSSVTTFQEGNLYGNGKEGFSEGHQVIKNSVDFKAFINKINLNNTVIAPKKADKINFDKYMLVAIFEDVHSRGGYSLAYKGLMTKKQKIILNLNLKTPGQMSTMVMTQPYLILKMPKTKAKIKVQK